MMTAILTDIHANREAFEACLAHAERLGATRHVLLGDFVGYGADPGWVVDKVMALVEAGATAVIGNHDLAATGGLRTPMSAPAQRALDWTRAQLTLAQSEFLAALPYEVEDGPLLYVHANAWKPDGFEYIDGVVEAGRSMRATKARITFCGHVHQPAVYHMGINQRVEHFAPIPGSALPLSAARRWLVLPGSCGQPRDGNPAACYALFDEVTGLLTTQRVPYDHPAAAAKVRAAGFAAPGDLSAIGR
ncbi:metallophosphoesterase family protein [Derxia gummosa]|uniref:Metallophosphoesterase family protein n=1 Tax=Derxia gummosa DSM 723 TaxID=1121388 RepID=A0A8B6X5M6_9BURK|nr:metallophosphoesterase family protein [Derxia gummosa]